MRLKRSYGYKWNRGEQERKGELQKNKVSNGELRVRFLGDLEGTLYGDGRAIVIAIVMLGA